MWMVNHMRTRILHVTTGAEVKLTECENDESLITAEGPVQGCFQDDNIPNSITLWVGPKSMGPKLLLDLAGTLGAVSFDQKTHSCGVFRAKG